MSKGYYDAVREQWIRGPYQECESTWTGRRTLPERCASGSPAGCRNAPFCSHCPGRQSIPASANVPNAWKPFVDHGRPCCTCKERRGGRAAGCRGTPPKCHGAWRGGACATPWSVRRPVSLGAPGGWRCARCAGSGSRCRGAVSLRPWWGASMELAMRRHSAPLLVVHGL